MSDSYNRFGPGKFGITIDCETSGSILGGNSAEVYQAISFGVIIYDQDTLEEVETLYVELQFDDTKYKWDPAAEKIHGFTREYLAEHGMSREDALVAIMSLIMKYMGPKPGPITLMAHNATFDRDMFNQLLDDFGMALKFHHVILDTSVIALGVAGIYKSNDVFELFADVDRDVHNALEDARACLTSLRTMREIFGLGLSQLD